MVRAKATFTPIVHQKSRCALERAHPLVPKLCCRQGLVGVFKSELDDFAAQRPKLETHLGCSVGKQRRGRHAGDRVGL